MGYDLTPEGRGDRVPPGLPFAMVDVRPAAPLSSCCASGVLLLVEIIQDFDEPANAKMIAARPLYSVRSAVYFARFTFAVADLSLE